MEVIDKIKVANTLSDIKVWQYARLIDLLERKTETEQEKVAVMCEVLELSTDKIAQLWREQYKAEFTLSIFEKVVKLLDAALTSTPVTEFIFTTLSPTEKANREEEIEGAAFWKKHDLRNNLKVDCNRKFTVEKTADQTFEQVIQTEMLVKEILTIDAEITVKNYTRLPRLLAFVCKLDGEQFHYYDKNDNQYKFNYALIEERGEVFKHLDIETAWGAYLGFFLTGRVK
jgi:hypothetical protein